MTLEQLMQASGLIAPQTLPMYMQQMTQGSMGGGFDGFDPGGGDVISAWNLNRDALMSDPAMRQVESKFNAVRPIEGQPGLFAVTMQRPGGGKYDTMEAIYKIDEATGQAQMVEPPRPTQQRSSMSQDLEAIGQGAAFTGALMGGAHLLGGNVLGATGAAGGGLPFGLGDYGSLMTGALESTIPQTIGGTLGGPIGQVAAAAGGAGLGGGLPSAGGSLGNMPGLSSGFADSATTALNGIGGVDGAVGVGGLASSGGMAGGLGLSGSALPTLWDKVSGGVSAANTALGGNLAPILGAVAGAASSGDQTQTSTREPWGPAQPFIRDMIARGQGLAQQYGAQPFSSNQQGAYDNLFGLLNQFNSSMAPGLLGNINAMRVGGQPVQAPSMGLLSQNWANLPGMPRGS